MVTSPRIDGAPGEVAGRNQLWAGSTRPRRGQKDPGPAHGRSGGEGSEWGCPCRVKDRRPVTGRRRGGLPGLQICCPRRTRVVWGGPVSAAGGGSYPNGFDVEQDAGTGDMGGGSLASSRSPAPKECGAVRRVPAAAVLQPGDGLRIGRQQVDRSRHVDAGVRAGTETPVTRLTRWRLPVSRWSPVDLGRFAYRGAGGGGGSDRCLANVQRTRANRPSGVSRGYGDAHRRTLDRAVGQGALQVGGGNQLRLSTLCGLYKSCSVDRARQQARQRPRRVRRTTWYSPGVPPGHHGRRLRRYRGRHARRVSAPANGAAWHVTEYPAPQPTIREKGVSPVATLGTQVEPATRR